MLWLGRLGVATTSHTGLFRRLILSNIAETDSLWGEKCSMFLAGCQPSFLQRFTNDEHEGFSSQRVGNRSRVLMDIAGEIAVPGPVRSNATRLDGFGTPQ